MGGRLCPLVSYCSRLDGPPTKLREDISSFRWHRARVSRGTCLHGIDEADSWHEASNKDQHHHDGKIGRGGGWWPTFPSSRLVIPPSLEGTALRRHHQHHHTTRAKPSCHTASSRDGVQGDGERRKIGRTPSWATEQQACCIPLIPPKRRIEAGLLKTTSPKRRSHLPTALRVRSGFQLLQKSRHQTALQSQVLLRTPTSSPSTVDTDTQTRRGGSGLTPLPLPHPQLSPNTHPSSPCPRAPLHHRHIRVPPLLLQRSWEDQVRLPDVT